MMIQLVCAEREQLGNVMKMLVCTEGERME